MSEYIVGIDFGASSIKAVINNGDKLLSLKLSKTGETCELPHVIWYNKMSSGKIQHIVGSKARNMEPVEPDNAVSWIKRKLTLPNWSKKIECMSSEVSAWGVAGDVLDSVKIKIAERTGLEKDQDLRAVLSVPVNFSTLQRRKLKEAAQKAGIRVEAIVTEPFAALFSMKNVFKMNQQLVFVFDFGASTLDVSIVKVDTSNKLVFKELAAAGLNLGGVDIDEAIAEKLIRPKYKDELEACCESLESPKIDKETAKKVLNCFIMNCARGIKEEIFGDDLDETEGNIYDIEVTVTRDELLELFEREHYKERIIEMLDNLFDDLVEGEDCFDKEDVTMILPFGGTSKINYFMEILEEYFDGKFDAESFSFGDNNDLNAGLSDRYMAVAGGAVVYAKRIKNGRDVEVENVIPFRIGYEWRDKFVSCIAKNAPRSFKAKAMPLIHNELDLRDWKVQIYQSFSVDSTVINKIEGSDDGAVYIATVQLNKKLYNTNEDVLMRMTIPSGDILQLTFYQLQLVGNETELAMIEKQEISIGG